jgi:hypothetical protein
MNKQPSTQDKLQVNFDHRGASAGGFDNSLLGLTDNIDSMARQATASLNLISMQFTDENTEKLNDDIMFWSIESVINQVQDIQALVSAYRKADIEKRQN